MDDSVRDSPARLPLTPLLPAHPIPAPGDPIEIYTGVGSLAGEEVGNIRIWMPLQRDAHVRAKIHAGVDLGRHQLDVGWAGVGRSTVEVAVHDSRGHGQVAETSLGGERAIQRVVCHWLNVPFMTPVDSLRDDGRIWLGHWSTVADGWELTLDARFDLFGVTQRMRFEDAQFAVTHVGELARADGGSFTASTAARVLHAWQYAMSFALGRWVAPIVPVGLDSAGHRVWEQWAPWRCDEMFGYQSWWSTNTADDLREFVNKFVTAFLNPMRHGSVRHLAYHAIAANHSGTAGEAKVLLAQAGIEYLAWNDLVLAGGMSSDTYRRMSAAEGIRKLLAAASIATEVPADLGQATQQVGTSMDGPALVTWLRNRLTHPKDPDEPYRLKGLVWETSQMLIEYAELLLLHRLGYNGRYSRRYPPGRWADTCEPVPWTQATPGSVSSDSS